jgi:hypothetical protein
MRKRAVKRTARYYSANPSKSYSRGKVTDLKKGSLWPLVVFVACSIIVLLFIVWYGQIQVVKYEFKNGQKPNIEKDFNGILNQSWFRNNLFFVSEDDFEPLYKHKYIQEIDSIEIKKVWQERSLVILLTGTEPLMRWRSDGGTYYIDEGGIASQKIDKGTGETLPLIIDESNIRVEEGTQVASSQFVIFVKQISTTLEEQSNLKIASLRVEESTNELFATTTTDITIRFATDNSASGQVESAKKVLIAAKKAGHTVSYIDVRLPHKAYYK